MKTAHDWLYFLLLASHSGDSQDVIWAASELLKCVKGQPKELPTVEVTGDNYTQLSVARP